MRTTPPSSLRSFLQAAVCLLVALAFLGGVLAREALHPAPDAEDLATLDRAVAHGHFHGDPSELMRLVHGHGAEAADHDQKPILARGPAPHAPTPAPGAPWREAATGPRAPPAYDLDRPPRV